MVKCVNYDYGGLEKYWTMIMGDDYDGLWWENHIYLQIIKIPVQMLGMIMMV